MGRFGKVMSQLVELRDLKPHEARTNVEFNPPPESVRKELQRTRDAIAKRQAAGKKLTPFQASALKDWQEREGQL